MRTTLTRIIKILLSLRAFAVMAAVALSTALAWGETSLNLDVGFGVRYVPPSQVTVPVGETLTVTAPDISPIHWTKNGTRIPEATTRTLTIPSVASADVGTYLAHYDGGRTSQALILGVGPTQRLTNLSTRAQVGAGEKTFIAGFVVSGRQQKKVILRAIGPTLTQFGVKEPVAEPVISVYDQDGKPYTNGYVYPAVVGGPTYESDLAESLAKTGAFPLPPGSKDAVSMMPFIPGAYSVHVNSADGTPGIVMLEIYEVP
jgi:hypothetical protein